MDRDRLWLHRDYKDELEDPWNWEGEYDPEGLGWENSPRFRKGSSVMLELSNEFGPFSIPHRSRSAARNSPIES